MNNSTLQILRNAISLSGVYNSDFNESELAEKSGISPQQIIKLIQDDKLQPFFSITKKSRIKCPKCSSFVDIDSSIAVCFCSECNEEINMSKVPIFTIGLNRQEEQIYLIEFLLKKFEEAGWIIRDSDENFFIIKNDKVSIAFSVCLDGNGLKDYFTLRGWGLSTIPTLSLSSRIRSINLFLLIKIKT